MADAVEEVVRERDVDVGNGDSDSIRAMSDVTVSFELCLEEGALAMLAGISTDYYIRLEQA